MPRLNAAVFPFDRCATALSAWADVNDNSLAPYAGSTGYQAIVQLARGYGQANPPQLPTIGDRDDYYSASLTLLAAIAQRETSALALWPGQARP